VSLFRLLHALPHSLLQRALRDLRGKRAIRERPGRLDLRDLLEQPDLQDLLEPPDLLDLQVLRDRQERTFRSL
jgi:hypothetical protein